MGQLAGLFDIGLRQQLAAPGVFQCQQAGAREMGVVWLDLRVDLGKRHGSIRRLGDRLRLNAAEHGRAARLPSIGMRHLADQIFVAALAMRHQCAEVALRAGGNKQRGLLAEQPGDPALQSIDRRIVAEDIVADIGFGDGRPHRRHRPGHGIAAQIDDAAHAASLDKSRKFFSIAWPCSVRIDSG